MASSSEGLGVWGIGEEWPGLRQQCQDALASPIPHVTPL